MGGINYFLFIGIETYHNEASFPKVGYALNDVEGVKSAYLALGFEAEDMITLTGDRATRTAILSNLEDISHRATKHDQITIFFAGHGFNEAGNNFIAPVDAVGNSIQKSCISINEIFGTLKHAVATKKLLFLDCCHSGFNPGESVRSTTGDFTADELTMMFREAEYTIGFASCKSNQKSISSSVLRHGVWSKFLIDALNGNADKNTYKKGLLFAGNLQEYLRDNTQQFIRTDTTRRVIQTPMMFGAMSGDFIVADLNPIFDKRAAERNAGELNFTSVIIHRDEDGQIKQLDGFDKKYHFVPSRIGAEYDKFVKRVSGDLVKDEIDELSKQIQELYKYKRKDWKSGYEMGEGWIETPDFDYSIVVSQSSTNAEDYVVKRCLQSIKNPNIVNEVRFNQLFEKYFTSISFKFSRVQNIEKIVDMLEERDIPVTYDRGSMDKCSFKLKNVDTEIIIYPDTMELFFTYPESPINLVASYSNARSELEMRDLPLLLN